MVRIENEEQYNAIISRIEELLAVVTDSTPATNPSCIELDMLSQLAEEYEETHFPIRVPSLSDTIKLRMYEMGLTQKAAAEKIGISPARLNEIISSKREPTFQVSRIISSALNISPSIVLGVDTE